MSQAEKPREWWIDPVNKLISPTKEGLWYEPTGYETRVVEYSAFERALAALKFVSDFFPTDQGTVGPRVRQALRELGEE